MAPDVLFETYRETYLGDKQGLYGIFREQTFRTDRQMGSIKRRVVSSAKEKDIIHNIAIIYIQKTIRARSVSKSPWTTT